MLLNCDIGEASWASLGLQGDPANPSERRSVLGVHWKDWCWSWNSNTLATSCEELTHLKRHSCWKDWGQEEMGMTEDEVVGWYHQLNGHGFGWTLGAGDGQGGLTCCGSRGRKELDRTERLNWTELISHFLEDICGLSHYIFFPPFLCIFHLGRLLKNFSLLFFGTFHLDGHIFPFLLCLFLLLFSAICKASSDNHFAFLHFFSLGVVLIPASGIILWNSVHSSSSILSIKPNQSLESICHFTV